MPNYYFLKKSVSFPPPLAGFGRTEGFGIAGVYSTLASAAPENSLMTFCSDTKVDHVVVGCQCDGPYVIEIKSLSGGKFHPRLPSAACPLCRKVCSPLALCAFIKGRLAAGPLLICPARHRPFPAFD